MADPGVYGCTAEVSSQHPKEHNPVLRTKAAVVKGGIEQLTVLQEWKPPPQHWAVAAEAGQGGRNVALRRAWGVCGFLSHLDLPRSRDSDLPLPSEKQVSNEK